MKKAIISIGIWCYRAIIKPVLIGLGLRPAGRVCMHIPSCSEYALQVLQKEPLYKGVFLATKRILSCHPWRKQ